MTIKTKNLADVCCERFYRAYRADAISSSDEKEAEADGNEWFFSGNWHLEFCPFCGAPIKDLRRGCCDDKKYKDGSGKDGKADN